MYLNVVVLGGHLTRDVELKYTQSGTAIASFGLAVNKKFTSDGEKREQVSFFDIDAWGKTAELCNEWLKKGSGVVIQGELKQESWEQDGNKRYKVKVVANSVQFLPKGEKSDQGGSCQGGSNSNNSNNSTGNSKNDPPF